MLLRILLLLVVALSVEAAAPVISCTPSRTSGTEPLNVMFDCSGTTDADTSKPFHDLLYRTNFGDTNVGTDTWTNGANTNASKNFATGPIAAHVFESCVGSPFTVTHYVTDGTNVSQTTNTITVACADDTYPSSSTVCFTNGTDFTGCPSGATQTGSTSSWGTVISCAGTTKRCLVRRGDTFTASANGTISNAGPITIGAYGSGAKPIVNNCTGCAAIFLNNTAVSDLRVMDIDFVGTGVYNAGGSESAVYVSVSEVSNITLLRLTVREMGYSSILWATGSGNGVTKSVIQDSTIYNNWGGYSIEVDCHSLCALLGNQFGPIATEVANAFSPVRIQRSQKSVFAHNTASSGKSGQTVWTMRSQVHSTSAEDTFYVVVSDNKITQGKGQGILGFDSSVGGDERIYDVIAERNWILGSSGYTGTPNFTKFGVVTRGTYRNNLIDMSACTTCAGLIGIKVQKDGGATGPNPTDNNIYNNTFYSSLSLEAYGVNTAGASVVDSVVKNNLCWIDLATTADCLLNSATNTTSATNSTAAQTKGTDPSFDGPTTTPSGFRISTSSYAANYPGTTIFPASNDDFLNCDDNTSAERIGAFVPQARARCTSAAGP